MMNLKEKGVSPVVGTILLIAITVVAAGTVAYFVMSQSQTTESAPTVNLTIDASAGDNTFNVGHDGGDTITNAFAVSATDNILDDLKITVNGYDVWENDLGDNADFSVGEEITLGDSEGGVAYQKNNNSRENIGSDDTIRVIYEPTGTVLAKTIVS